MRRTGIFFLPVSGQRLKDFPRALGGLLEQPSIVYREAFHDYGPVAEGLVACVHAPTMIAAVRRTPFYQTALYSGGGSVAAALEVWQGHLDNAFVFTGVGGHHAGRDYFWGGCYLNSAAMAVCALRQHFGVRRCAIVDTDSHHGDGTRDIFAQDDALLHLCLCDQESIQGTKIDLRVPWRATDASYLAALEKRGLPWLYRLRPEVILWEFGFDTTRGDYGDRGLSPEAHIVIARVLQEAADVLCQGRLITVLCGGSRRDLATAIIPAVIAQMAGLSHLPPSSRGG